MTNLASDWQRRVRTIHTLGPSGTNCEAAARHWFELQGRTPSVELHSTLEEALDYVLRVREGVALMGCVVYPNLHRIVFENLDRLQMVDLLLVPTLPMVLASAGSEPYATVATHPAPASLVPAESTVILADSNSRAAELCVSGKADACITTLRAARMHGLTTVRDFGPVPMGFTVHVPMELRKNVQ